MRSGWVSVPRFYLERRSLFRVWYRHNWIHQFRLTSTALGISHSDEWLRSKLPDEITETCQLSLVISDLYICLLLSFQFCIPPVFEASCLLCLAPSDETSSCAVSIQRSVLKGPHASILLMLSWCQINFWQPASRVSVIHIHRLKAGKHGRQNNRIFMEQRGAYEEVKWTLYCIFPFRVLHCNILLNYKVSKQRAPVTQDCLNKVITLYFNEILKTQPLSVVFILVKSTTKYMNGIMAFYLTESHKIQKDAGAF